MKVAVFIVARTSFGINHRLPLLRACLEMAHERNADVAVFPGGFFRITSSDENSLQNELHETAKQFSTLPFLTGVDFLAAEGTKGGATPVKKALYKKINKTNNGLGPWVWVVSSIGVTKIEECWRKDGQHRPLGNTRRTGLMGFSVLPMVCGDVFVPGLASRVEPVNLICVSAHWKLWPAQWTRTLRAISHGTRAPLVLAQHLIMPPGHNYAYDRAGQDLAPESEERVNVKCFCDTFCRVYNCD